ncbi:Maf family nucleotide pyrophosphatase [Rhizobium sp. C4]|uniref:Maf family nucleotide pyrophosphatase n=1 Tax=Rhizobium sp. C4 TaxID=1349800 RepID=UPI001E629CDF|nr:Maf family nucleotide pyrophosphatase [Rhizobium sp. C4]MCD2174694.1 Maf family nucleotide pyrophosphatase [Rhizobium sp. C4]
MTKEAPLILASGSPFRKQLMDAAGLIFAAEPASIDEREIEAPLAAAGASAESIALALAKAKASEVAGRHSASFVIGSDQVMSMDGRLFHKCTSVEMARDQLRSMRGRTHRLSSAISIVRDDREVWSHVSVADMTFRNFSDAFLDDYIERAGPKVLLTVGAYSYEGLGQQLFEKVEGDFFTIIGLPMLPLLAALRDLAIIPR